MTPKRYYKAVLNAIYEAKAWAGSKEPAEGEAWRQYCEKLTKETVKRLRRCKR